MNKNSEAEKDKIMMPIRLESSLYQKMMDLVYQKKKTARGYSANRFITELIENAILKNDGGVR